MRRHLPFFIQGIKKLKRSLGGALWFDDAIKPEVGDMIRNLLEASTLSAF
ncbi:hypothetical protein Hanom_Chr02g00138121 [Helianthus anomalus]